MRYVLLSVLLAIPIAVSGWVFWSGRQPPVDLEAERARRDEAALLSLVAPSGPAPSASKPRLFDRETLFEHINGAAPKFLERGFWRLAAVDLALPGGEAAVEIYDMVRPENARAVFEAERPAKARDVPGWSGAATGSLSFLFHEGRYYVKLVALDPEAEPALSGLARTLRARMP